MTPPASGAREAFAVARMANKLRDEQCSFKIYPTQKMTNSETKRIGDTLDRFVKNEIDQDFLKRSHLPFANVRQQISETQKPQMSSNGYSFSPVNLLAAVRPSVTGSPARKGEKELAIQFKQQSEAGNVPFSSARRSGREEANSKMNITTVNAQTFAWKVPTVMQ